MRKVKTFSRTSALALSAALLLGACGSGDNPSSATSSYNAKARKAQQAKAKAGAEDLSDMVAAVTAAKSGPPVEVKFALGQKPEVGQPLDVNVAVVPGAPPPLSISVTFQSVDGLEIVSGGDPVKVDKPADGTPIRRTVKVLPKQDGIFSVSAVVTLTEPHESPVRTFEIPIIAGQGVPEAAARPEAGKGL